MNRLRLLVAGLALPFIAQAAAPAPRPPDLPAFELTLIDMQGQKKVLGTLPGSVFAPRISPDGTRVAFELADDTLPNQPENRRLYVADLDKLDKRRPLMVTVTTTRNLAPVWSADSEWIAFLATGVATDLIERRLARAGAVRRQEKRGLLGTKVRFVPTEPGLAAWPGTRIRIAATRGELLDSADLVLTGLVLATGLDQYVLVTLESRERDQLFDQMRRRLPAMLQHLVGHAEAAVGDAVMARRA